MNTVSSLPEVILVGGLFDSDDDTQETAFISAVNHVNSKRSILSKSRLLAQVERIPPNDSFEAANRVCSLMSKGVAAIFGPQSPTSAAHVQSICDTFAVPHIETRWDPGLGSKMDSINLYPHPTVLSRAYVDLVREWGWKEFAILYEDNDGLVRLRDLFETQGRTFFSITVRQLPSGDDYRDVLREIKKHNKLRIIVDCCTAKVFRVLKQAQQVGMMTEFHHYLMTSLDVDTIDMEDFRHGGTVITSLRLIDPKRPEVNEVVKYLQTSEKRLGRATGESSQFMLRTETALIFDAVYLFAKALHDLDSSQHIHIKPLSCESEKPWTKSGTSLTNYMKSIQLEGLSGIVGFLINGVRPHFDLDIMELQKRGLVKVGYWSSQEKDKKRIGLNITTVALEKSPDDSLRNKVLNITTLLTEPYAMIKESKDPQSGNDRFEGFCIDLVHEISLLLGFNYTIYEVEDKENGKLINETTGEWSGIIGAVKSGRADLGIGDMTITLQRETAVDFTTPFMNLGISILFRKPEPAPPSFLSFLAPFSNDVWLYMCITYVGVSCTLFVLARLSPDEWDNPYPCIQEPDVLKNEFGMMNSLWFTIGSLMQQGSDIAPKAASTRLVAGMWWLFTLIMISSYTATLTAFLTVETRDSSIKTVEDLAKQTKIKYGCLDSGSTQAFFKNSSMPMYQEMYAYMTTVQPSVFPKNPFGNKEGEQRVVKGNYAFFMESNSIEYITERNCNLTQVGGLLDNKGYGIALIKDSPYRSDLSAAILHLQENGTLQALKTKWWKQKRGGGQCKDSSSSMPKPLGLPNVSGIFVVLLGGMAVSSFAAFMEFFYKTRTVASDERESMCKEMVKELKFAMSCKNSKKINKKRPAEPENGMAMPLAKYGFGDGDIFT